MNYTEMARRMALRKLGHAPLSYARRDVVLDDLIADGLARRNGERVEITDDGRTVLAMREAAIRDARALVPVVPRGKPWRPGSRGTSAHSRYCYPSRADVEAQAKNLERNEDGEFSSPELTAWYVREYLRATNLKR